MSRTKEPHQNLFTAFLTQNMLIRLSRRFALRTTTWLDPQISSYRHGPRPPQPPTSLLRIKNSCIDLFVLPQFKSLLPQPRNIDVILMYVWRNCCSRQSRNCCHGQSRCKNRSSDQPIFHQSASDTCFRRGGWCAINYVYTTSPPTTSALSEAGQQKET